jgi:hypothetical protein
MICGVDPRTRKRKASRRLPSARKEAVSVICSRGVSDRHIDRGCFEHRDAVEHSGLLLSRADDANSATGGPNVESACLGMGKVQWVPQRS